MRHLNKKITLGREIGPRKALLRVMAENLVLHESVKTTKAKAKAIKTVIEPLITKAVKKDILTARRTAVKVLCTAKAVKKLVDEIAPRYKDRKGGYTRMIKLMPRATDGAEMVKIEFV